ncbi:hypothetical protein F3Y22_tig00003041pilonHSYRG00844 [Hibiscus syriacus]|uniref:Integrase catalytic domain-containing protein n=1 Tax=Hibiscus syriacus TaxID=106335 RepID=A0A6A3CSD3_HIBSY|nr:hypothetical protein F3Y22_tig00003041pilonHSYRG00844 [Hibiscus syriacus]
MGRCACVSTTGNLTSLTNAPATFCTLMNKLFQPYLDQFMVVYLDDIVEKCTFATEEVHFLGHVIDHGKLLMDGNKIKAITEWESSTKKAFEDLKAAVSQEPVLALPDFTMPFEVHTDASDLAIGGVLMQEGHPIAFESHKLNDTERRYTVQDKEMTAIIHCLRVWRHYLLGAHFTIKTNNVATSYFQTQKKLSPKQASRKAELAVISLAKGTVLERIKEGLEQDPMTRELVKLASDGKTQWRDLIKECNDTKWAGHPGQKRTMALLETTYFWPHIKDSVEFYVKTCLVCQQDKVENRQPAGLLEPLPVSQRPWDSITLDFISALPKSEGYGSIMVVVDRFSKYGTFIPCPKDCTTEEAVRAFFKNVVKHWGLPRSIINDRDPRFTGRLWTNEERERVENSLSFSRRRRRRWPPSTEPMAELTAAGERSPQKTPFLPLNPKPNLVYSKKHPNDLNLAFYLSENSGSGDLWFTGSSNNGEWGTSLKLVKAWAASLVEHGRHCSSAMKRSCRFRLRRCSFVMRKSGQSRDNLGTIRFLRDEEV